MASETRQSFLLELAERFGPLRKLAHTHSLYEVGEGLTRVYVRYSKVHPRNRTFFGLREQDLKQLEGFRSFICFLWEGQTDPLWIPYSEYEEVFQTVSPAQDGQYKVQIYLQEAGMEIYIARVGRFNVEGHMGWAAIEALTGSDAREIVPMLTHPQMQTLLGR